VSFNQTQPQQSHEMMPSFLLRQLHSTCIQLHVVAAAAPQTHCGQQMHSICSAFVIHVICQWALQECHLNERSRSISVAAAAVQRQQPTGNMIFKPRTRGPSSLKLISI
jgi:hypothetical protein